MNRCIEMEKRRKRGERDGKYEMKKMRKGRREWVSVRVCV